MHQKLLFSMNLTAWKYALRQCSEKTVGYIVGMVNKLLGKLG